MILTIGAMKKTNVVVVRMMGMSVLIFFAFLASNTTITAQNSLTPDALVSSDFVSDGDAIQAIKLEVTSLENAVDHSLGGLQEADFAVRAAFMMKIAEYLEEGVSVSNAIEAARPFMTQMINGINVTGIDPDDIFNDVVTLLAN